METSGKPAEQMTKWSWMEKIKMDPRESKDQGQKQVTRELGRANRVGDLWEAAEQMTKWSWMEKIKTDPRESKDQGRTEQVTRGTRESQQSGRPLGSQQSR